MERGSLSLGRGYVTCVDPSTDRQRWVLGCLDSDPCVRVNITTIETFVSEPCGFTAVERERGCVNSDSNIRTRTCNTFDEPEANPVETSVHFRQILLCDVPLFGPSRVTFRQKVTVTWKRRLVRNHKSQIIPPRLHEVLEKKVGPRQTCVQVPLVRYGDLVSEVADGFVCKIGGD